MISIPVLLNVAFLTLLERKIISYSQLRKGPNKVSFLGILQPFPDAIKLFLKEIGIYGSVNSNIFILSPMLGLGIAMMLWNLCPLKYAFMIWSVSWIGLLAVMGMSVYPLFLMGWSSNCIYSFIGGVRGVAQVISYEVVFTILIFMIMMLSSEVSLLSSMKFNSYFIIYLLSPLIIMLWFMSGLAETNRSPFDFSEGEGELVSGFNTEYGGSSFAMIFMAEYASILLLSTLFSLVMFSSDSIMFYLISSMGCFIWVWSRVTYPRCRYDLLMMMCWKSLMPSVLLSIMGLMMLMMNI
uniref:NADH-ubiquinone oxidoreductase chain 1 n=1 Tax=Caligus clemensi TaxID=344056 RepID=E1B2Q6_CALCM|nr:NADH dehydrogenase subunit 1 [Caligus clemensi]